jgi:uncharacterized protein
MGMGILRGKGKEKYVLDTSLFVNPYGRKYFGESVDDAIRGFLEIASKNKKAKFLAPPSVRKELKYFANKDLPSFKNIIIVKSPSLHELKVPAVLMYKFIDEIRTRVNSGLRVSEKFVKDKKLPLDEKLHKLRVQYKEALREGILDSEEDFEVMMLAKEQNAALITLDLGLVKAAEEFGIRCMEVKEFYDHISTS